MEVRSKRQKLEEGEEEKTKTARVHVRGFCVKHACARAHNDQKTTDNKTLSVSTKNSEILSVLVLYILLILLACVLLACLLLLRHLGPGHDATRVSRRREDVLVASGRHVVLQRYLQLCINNMNVRLI